MDNSSRTSAAASEDDDMVMNEMDKSVGLLWNQMQPYAIITPQDLVRRLLNHKIGDSSDDADANKPISASLQTTSTAATGQSNEIQFILAQIILVKKMTK